MQRCTLLPRPMHRSCGVRPAGRSQGTTPAENYRRAVEGAGVRWKQTKGCRLATAASSG